MFLKSSVKVDGIKPEILIGIMVAKDVWRDAGLEMTITSCKDGTHKQGSLHYKGWAVDIRTKDVADMDTKFELVEELKKRLTNDYDVVFESIGESNEHVHLEWDAI